ncbi:hypothetical protein [Mangrovibacillus cuniculi]|uniref:Uncharacterized protein n=1 Tax=Mangrovibacillus cuniculi TaxID=2593652 RepID=A0A7S8CCY6_9BACI|nr:hypothetical protein [Mangrovibacillus cuniculi]QPC47561.1 hypothetical protein G8O30_11670 [Mangrovibacillus cuniculi]
MNFNLHLKCEVCSNTIRLKVYAGYEPKNSFSYSCPECKIRITGHLIWNDNLEESFIKEFSCINAKNTVEFEKESHVLQVATEFYTDKIKKFDPNDPTLYLSPFMMESISFELKRRKQRFVSNVTENFSNDYKVSNRLWQLYKMENYKYLNRQLLSNKFVEPVLLGEILKIDYSDKLLEVLYKPFLPFLIESKKIPELINIRNQLSYLKKNHSAELHQLKIDLEELLNYSEAELILLLDNFSKYYSYIWPIILSTSLNTEDIDEIKEKKGILTTDFQDLKNYYVEAFEVLASALPILLGIQNIKFRKSRNIFHESNVKKFKNINSIIDYHHNVRKKGYKIQFFEEENMFSSYDITKVLNNEIRNSIGHYSYNVESDQQLIHFIDGKKTCNLYLIEFADLLLQTFYATFFTFEVVFFLKNNV